MKLQILLLLGLLPFIIGDDCDFVADIAFVMDSSSSVKPIDFKMEMDFVKSVAHAFGTKKDGNQFAVILFAWTAQIMFRFSDVTDMDSFDKKVDGLTQLNGMTRIDHALNLAKNELFTAKSGIRPNATKILFLFTDGRQTQDGDAVSPAGIADTLRKDGHVILVAIGVGPQTDKNALDLIGGGASYSANSFATLTSKKFVHNLVNSTCKGVGDLCKKNNGGCEDKCNWNGMNAICSCTKAGMVLASDKKNCVKEDLCKNNNGGCEGKCNWNGTNAICSCTKAGMVLASDKKNCVKEDLCKKSNGGCDDKCNWNGVTAICSCTKAGMVLASDKKNCVNESTHHIHVKIEVHSSYTEYHPRLFVQLEINPQNRGLEFVPENCYTSSLFHNSVFGRNYLILNRHPAVTSLRTYTINRSFFRFSVPRDVGVYQSGKPTYLHCNSRVCQPGSQLCHFEESRHISHRIFLQHDAEQFHDSYIMVHDVAKLPDSRYE